MGPFPHDAPMTGITKANPAGLAGFEFVEFAGPDGARDPSILLRIFSKTMIGPTFFGFIQRKGDDGFGEGNVQALCDAIARDRIHRGVLASS